MKKYLLMSSVAVRTGALAFKILFSRLLILHEVILLTTSSQSEPLQHIFTRTAEKAQAGCKIN